MNNDKSSLESPNIYSFFVISFFHRLEIDKLKRKSKWT